MELEARQRLRALQLDTLELGGVEAEELERRWCDLRGWPTLGTSTSAFMIAESTMQAPDSCLAAGDLLLP